MQKAKDADVSNDSSNMCDDLMIDNIHKGMNADWYCQKYCKSLPNGMIALLYCYKYYSEGNCYTDPQKK